jgi:hypothetical protein
MYVGVADNVCVKVCTEKRIEIDEWVMCMSNLRIYVKLMIYNYNSLFTNTTNLLQSITIVFCCGTIALTGFPNQRNI